LVQTIRVCFDRGSLLRALALLAISLLTSGCEERETARMVQTTGSVSAALDVSPGRPAPMREVELRLALSNSGQDPITGAAVVFDATMPGMEMPENRFEGVEESGGIYRGRTVLTMAGAWRLRVEVVSRDTRRDFIFDLATR
jgi:YtkA-like